jgi:hypothetical protein
MNSLTRIYLPKLSLLLLLLLLGCDAEKRINTQDFNIMFDDFSYDNNTDIAIKDFGWTIRNGKGGPGISGATWSSDYISFIEDKENSANKVMRLTASTNGSASGTFQSEIYHELNYLEGTYAARIFFTDSPISNGIDGDYINQTFFAISPHDYDLDPNYSELDFAEYLPNGGWGNKTHTMWMTSWETYQAEPWIQESKSQEIAESFVGWHIVSASVHNGQITYYIDGKLKATHAEEYYPEQKMSISFNLWFISGGLLKDKSQRTYEQLVDWVYFSEDSSIKHSELAKEINALRKKGLTRINEIVPSGLSF